MLGAYGVAMTTRFNGFGDDRHRRGAGRADGLDVRPGQALPIPDPPGSRGAQDRPLLASQGRRQEAPPSIGRLDLSTHPFCIGPSPTDVRMTWRLQEDDFRPGMLYGILHETGHGNYEQGMPEN